MLCSPSYQIDLGASPLRTGDLSFLGICHSVTRDCKNGRVWLGELVYKDGHGCMGSITVKIKTRKPGL